MGCPRYSSALLCLTIMSFATAVCVYAQNPTQLENSKPGSPDWQLTNPAMSHEIEGYASLTSVNRGGQISLFVNTIDPTFTIDVFRMGWYGGAGARRMMAPVQWNGTQQIAPPPDSTTGVVDCNWSNPYTLNVPLDALDPTNWASGIYLARLTGNPSGKQSYIIFVVRDDSRASTYLFQLSVNTYQAYNNWGGKSLYGFNSLGSPAINVSFNRPYALGTQSTSAWGVGAGLFLATPIASGFSPAGWEYNMVRFLEREGYDTTFMSDVDAHENGNLFLNHKALVVAGHSEYWSWQMRTNLKAARDAGISLGFFSGNNIYWQVRYSPSAVTGAADRVIVCYKSSQTDPFAANPSTANLTTTQWAMPPVNLPTDAILGSQTSSSGQNTDIIVTNPANWIFTYTGLSNGDHLAGLLGDEVDSMQGHQPSGTISAAHEVLSNGTSDTTIYTAASGATVFDASTFQWSWGVDDFNTPLLRNSVLNPAVQQITRNVLAQLAGLPLSPSFSVVPSPRAQTASLGTTVNFAIQFTPFGYSPTVTFSASGLPPGAVYSFAPSSLNGPGSTVLSITPSQNSPMGTYTVTISATDGTQVRTEAVSLALWLVPRANWSVVFVDSQATGCYNGAASNAFDGNPFSLWVTQICGSIPGPPHEIQIDMGAAYPITGFRYLPRVDGLLDGIVLQYEFYATNNLSNWGTPLSAGKLGNDTSEKQVLFSATSARYIRFRALSDSGYPFAAVAEINVLQPPSTSPPPTILNLSPTSGPTGTLVAVSGSNFGSTQGSGFLSFNGSVASIGSWSDSTILATVPAAASTGSVVVSASGGSSNGQIYTVIPTVVGLAPNSGVIGSTVTVTGSGFGATQGMSAVTFNGVVASTTSWNSSNILALVPAGATSGNVIVTVGGKPSNGVGFTVNGSLSNGYAHFRPITIDHTKIPNSDQANFPVLISGTYSYLATTQNGGGVSNAGGFDIIFTSDSAGTTRLPFERESYNPATGAINAWVNIPLLSHTVDTVFYMFFGNSSITADQSNRTGTWDANYAAVYHLPNGTSLSAVDSTLNGNNGSIIGALTATAGQIDGAASSFSTGSYIRNSAAIGFDGISGLTVSAWIDPTSISYVNPIGEKGTNSGNYAWFFSHGAAYGSPDGLSLQIRNGCAGGSVSVPIITGSWSNIVGTWDGTQIRYYLNGSPIGSAIACSGAMPMSTAEFDIGQYAQSYAFLGGIDEFRVSRIARSPDWIAAEYHNQQSPSTFYSIGTGQ